MAEPAPVVSVDSLPFLEEYLQEVLRPRAERVLQSVERSLTEVIWRQVVKALAAEQSNAGEATPAMIRYLLEQRLGLRIEASLKRGFRERVEGEEAPSPEVVVTGTGAGARR